MFSCDVAHSLPLLKLHLYAISITAHTLNYFLYLLSWACAWQNQQNDLCAQRRLKSAWATAWISLIIVFAVHMKKPWVLSHPLSAQRRLIRLGGLPGWSVFAGRTGHFVGSVIRRLILEQYHNDPKYLYRHVWPTHVDPGQTAPNGAVWSGSTVCHLSRLMTKPTKLFVRQVKTQIRPVWSVFTARMKKLGSSATHRADSEDWSD